MKNKEDEPMNGRGDDQIVDNNVQTGQQMKQQLQKKEVSVSSSC